MPERGVVSRLLAFVHALLPEDWVGRAGRAFSATTHAIDEFAEEHNVRPKELADEGVELVRTALHGKANKDLAAAMKDFAEAENTRIQAELQRRSLESKVRKEEAEATLAELQVVHSEAELLKKLQDLKVVVRRDEHGHLTILPAENDLNLATLADQRLEAAVIRIERAILGMIILDNSVLQDCMRLHPEDLSVYRHQLIYQAILELSNSNRGIDFITLTEQLQQYEKLDPAGGVEYVTSLIDGAPHPKGVKQYLDFILKRKGLLGTSAAAER